MKILITGQNSYIGTSFENWTKQQNPDWLIDTIDVRGDEWKKTNFSEYDSVLHVAGIAHVSADPKLKDLYYQVNRDLAIELALKAKQDGAKQLIFMSSMILYGEDEGVGIQNIITRDTKPKALNFYGDSKLQADIELQKLSDDNFNISIIRTPMVYGPNGKGNFPKLLTLARYTPIFPTLDNKRSMIFIDNLCEFIRLLVENKSKGIFFPQNNAYVSTKDVVKMVAKVQKRPIWFMGVANPVIRFSSKYLAIINKVFGNKIYDMEISNDFDMKYNTVDFEESIRRCLSKGE